MGGYGGLIPSRIDQVRTRKKDQTVSEGSSFKERSRSVRSAVFYSDVPSPDHSDSDTLRSNSPKTSRAPNDRCQSGSRLRHAVASSPCTSSAATSADLGELITDDDRSRTSVSSSSSSGRAAAAVCVVVMQHNNNNALPPSTANTVVTQVSNDRSAHSAAANSEYKTEKVQRKWQVLPGRNRYWCDGRIIMSRQSGVFYFTVILIGGTMGLFFGFDAPYLWRHVSPAIPIVAACLLALVLAQLLRTSFSDPGVMPRADVAEAMHTENQINLEQPAGTALANMYRPPPRTREVVINGQPVKLKYCFTCHVFRLPRTSHCSVFHATALPMHEPDAVDYLDLLAAFVHPIELVRHLSLDTLKQFCLVHLSHCVLCREPDGICELVGDLLARMMDLPDSSRAKYKSYIIVCSSSAAGLHCGSSFEKQMYKCRNLFCSRHRLRRLQPFLPSDIILR